MTTTDLYYEVPAVSIKVGMVINDERWAHVMKVGHVAIARKWVSARSFHPETNVHPNAAYKVLRGDTVRVMRDSIPAEYWSENRIQPALEWSVNIHGAGSDRHLWVVAAANALLDGVTPPPFPGRPMPGVAAARLETIRRLLGMEVP